MTTPVSEFYAKLGVQVDKKSLKGVDKFFADLENRLAGVGKPLTSRTGVVSGFKQLTKEVNNLAKAERRRSETNRVAVNKEIAQNNRLAKSRQRVAEVTSMMAPVPRSKAQGTVRNRTPASSVQQQRRASLPLSEFINRQMGIGPSGGFSRTDKQRQYESIFGINSKLNRVSSRMGSRSNVLVNLASKEEDIRSGRRGKVEALAAKLQLEAAKRQQQAAKTSQRNAEWDRRRKIMDDQANAILDRRERLTRERWAKREEERLRKEAQRARVSQSRIRRGNYLAAGGATGALARYGLASLPFVGGAYGLSSLNRANQALMSTEISSGAIFGERATDARMWLQRHADYVGYNYLETMPIFSQFMAAGINSMGYDKSLGIFEGFSEFGRTRGADKQGMQRGLRAISQMASKGKITAEELRLQLSEATGFGEAVPIFAEAWQQLNGGELRGSEATAALFKAMEKGDVYSDKLLPIVGQIMKQRASGGIDAARTSSIAEQARAENAQTMLLGTFSRNGGEEGFARFWRSIAWALKELDPLVKGMAGLFERLSVVMQAPVRLLGMLGTAVGYLSDRMGVSEKNIVTFAALGGLLFTKWGRIGTLFTGIVLAIEDVAFAMMGKDSLTLRFMHWLENITGFSVDQTKGIFAVAGAFLAIAGGLKAIDIAKKGLPSGLMDGGSSGPSKGKGGLVQKTKNALLVGGTAAVIGADPLTAAIAGAGTMLPFPLNVGAYGVAGFNELSTRVNAQVEANPTYVAARAVTPPTFEGGMEQMERLRNELISGSAKTSPNVTISEGAIQMNVTTDNPVVLANKFQEMLDSKLADVLMEFQGDY